MNTVLLNRKSDMATASQGVGVSARPKRVLRTRALTWSPSDMAAASQNAPPKKMVRTSSLHQIMGGDTLHPATVFPSPGHYQRQDKKFDSVFSDESPVNISHSPVGGCVPSPLLLPRAATFDSSPSCCSSYSSPGDKSREIRINIRDRIHSEYAAKILPHQPIQPQIGNGNMELDFMIRSHYFPVAQRHEEQSLELPQEEATWLKWLEIVSRRNFSWFYPRHQLHTLLVEEV